MPRIRFLRQALIVSYLFITSSLLAQNYPTYTIDTRLAPGETIKKCFQFQYPTNYGKGAERTVMICLLMSSGDIESSRATTQRLNGLYTAADADLNVPAGADAQTRRRYRWLTAFKVARARERDVIDKLRTGLAEVLTKEGIRADERYLFLTRFVQSITYFIPPKTHNWGFYAPVTVLSEKAGDCDSKSLLLAMILRGMGAQHTMLMVSFEYGHAMLGINEKYIPGFTKGAFFKTYKGEKYYFIESTNPKANFGELSSKMSDLSKWEVYDPLEFNLWEK